MKIVSTRNNLRDAFQLAERFTGKNITLPLLSHILFEADDSKAHCVATNLEIGVDVAIPCKVVSGGVVAVPGKIINTVIQSIEEESIVLEEKDSVVTLKTDSSFFLVQGIQANDFPLLPKIKKERECTVLSGELRKGLAQVIVSAAVSDFKPELASVFFKKDSKTLVLAATDSFRLAEKTMVSGHSGDACMFILPSRTAQEILRILPDTDDWVTIREGENQVLFEVNSIRVISRVVDGVYPDYQTIIPNDFESHLSVNREEMIKKIRAASILSSKLNEIAIHFSQEETFLEATNAEVGKSKIHLAAKTKGKENKVSFNFRYLLDGIEATSGEEVVLSLGGDSSPALIRDPNNASFRYVAMPIRNV